MKKLIGFILCLFLGWFVGFLRIPYLENNDSFFQGFVIALACVLLVFLLLKTQQSNSNYSSTKRSSNKLFTLIVVSLCLLSSIILYREYNQSKRLSFENQKLSDHINAQNLIIEKAKSSSQELLLSNILFDVREELNLNSKRVLSDSTIDKIAALNQSFKPYRYSLEDTAQVLELSPERGRLLLTLVSMNIDSISFLKIIQRVSFAKADLRACVLKGVNLAGINIDEADLSNSDLQAINISSASAKGANFWGAKMDKAIMNRTDLTNADLAWTSLDGANISFSEISGANLSNAELRKADLSEATMKWTKLNGAVLIEAKLIGTDLIAANLSRANFSQAQMQYSRLSKANLNDAIFLKVDFSDIVAREGWFEKLKTWNVNDWEQINKEFELVEGKSDRFKKEEYVLRKI